MENIFGKIKNTLTDDLHKLKEVIKKEKELMAENPELTLFEARKEALLQLK